MKFILSGLLFFGALSAQAKIVTRSVGVVGKNVITSRQVKISFYIDKALTFENTPVNKIPKTGWGLDEQSEPFKKQLNQKMLEMMVNEEAENFSVAHIEKEIIKDKSKKAIAILKPIEAWKDLEVEESEVESIINLKYRTRAFLKFKAETANQVISDEEGRSYYERNQVKFSGLPYDQVKGTIKEFLRQEQTQEKLKDWFEVLKRKYKVKNLDNNP
jgi:hypothetical protein